jgi:hypothetical protein
MNLPDTPVAPDGFLVAHFLTVSDQAKSREFYTGVTLATRRVAWPKAVETSGSCE